MNKSHTFPKEEMDELLVAFHGRIGIYIKDLATGTSYEYCADERFPTASVFKVPITIELFRQAEEGRISLDERHRLQGEISSHGTGVLKLMQDEPELTLRDYCRLMIAVSDNMATDLLLEIVGLPSANATMDTLGFPNTRLNVQIGRWHYLMAGMGDYPCSRENDALFLKKVKEGSSDYDSLPYSNSLDNNVTTPREMGEILERLQRGQIVSPGASAEMVEMLKQCAGRTKIPRYLDPSIEIAHKIGSSNGIQVDAGIVFLPTGPLVISAFSFRRGDSSARRESIAQITRTAVDAISPESIAD